MKTNTTLRISLFLAGIMGLHVIAQGAAQPPNIIVNEILSHAAPPLVQAIELYNPTGISVGIGGWFLTDNSNNPKKYRIPDGTTIDAGGHRVFYENTSFGTGPGAFTLSPKGGEVYVYSADAAGNLSGHVHGFQYGAQVNGVTFGRYINSVGAEQFVAQSSPSLGSGNTGPKVGPVVISEINYHPPEVNIPGGLTNNFVDEFIELQNTSGSNVPLFDPSFPTNTWRLRNGVNFSFPINTILPAGGFLLVVGFNPADPEAELAFRFRNRVPFNILLYGPYAGALGNQGGIIELATPTVPIPPPAPDAGLVPYVLVDQVEYQSAPPWPAYADGLGPTLQRITAGAYGDDPINWTAAGPTPGAAWQSGPAPLITQQPADTSAVLNYSTRFSVSATGPEPLSFQWRHNGSVLPGETASVLYFYSVEASNAGQYDCAVRNASGATLSSPATLTVLMPATITQQPTSVDVRVRPDPAAAPVTNVSFTVGAVTLHPPLRYQWRFRGSHSSDLIDIPGATDATLLINNVTVDHDGDYSCAVTDGIGTVVSSIATLYPLVTPTIEVPPLSQSVAAGSPVTVSVALRNGSPAPFGYQWRSNSFVLGTITSTSKTNIFTILGGSVPSDGSSATYSLYVTNRAHRSPGVAATFTFNTLPDSDHDGMPDAYEQLYALNPNNPSDALSDLDGDGMSNLDEYRAGSNPADPDSVLRIEVHSTPDTVDLTFTAVANRTYTVQRSETLPAEVWRNLVTIPAHPTNRIEVLPMPSRNLGRSDYGRLQTPAERDEGSLARYRMVSAGYNLTCAITPAGQVLSWGCNNEGQFGNGTKEPPYAFCPSVGGQFASGISDAIEVAAGRTGIGQGYACAVLKGGAVKCWGKGPLGDGTFGPSLTPVPVSGISDAIHVAAGSGHACAVTSDGRVKCWGNGGGGELGDGLSRSSLAPVDVAGISSAIDVAVDNTGTGHSCALLRDGTVMCWGANSSGQLGNGTTAKVSATPVAVPGLRATAIAAGGEHTCALLADGTIKCWGWNNYGQLGNGRNGPGTESSIPVQVVGITRAIAVAAGWGYTCALLADGSVWCWGDNGQGQCTGTASPPVLTPTRVPGVVNAVAVTAGFDHTCALLRDRTIKCWGNNGAYLGLE